MLQIEVCGMTVMITIISFHPCDSKKYNSIIVSKFLLKTSSQREALLHYK